MTSHPSVLGRTLAGLGALTLFAAAPLAAQVCVGTPSQNSVAFARDQFSIGNANGAAGSLVGSRFAGSLEANARSISSDVSGFGARLGVNGIFGASRVTICPGVTLGFTRDTWEPGAGVSTSINTAALGAGVGAGFTQELGAGVAISPFARLGFGFNLTVYDLDAPNAETDVTGDTLSGVTFDYGAIVQWRYLYGGLVSSRAPGETDAPTALRILVGFTFREREGGR
jgi:hypothetical protein